MKHKIENFDRNNPPTLNEIIKEDGKIQVVDKLANLIATFYSPRDAAKFLIVYEDRYIKLDFENGRYDLFTLNIDSTVNPVVIENNSYKF